MLFTDEYGVQLMIDHAQIEALTEDEAAILEMANKVEHYKKNGYKTYYFSHHSKSTVNELVDKISIRKRREASSAARQESMLYCVGKHTQSDLEELYDAQQGLCYFSMALLSKSPKNYEKDHLHPVSKDGTDWPDNLALILKSINTKKSSKSLASFTRAFYASYSKAEHEEIKQWQKEVRKRRKAIHKERVRSMKNVVAEIDHKLKQRFDGDIEYVVDEKSGIALFDYKTGININFPGSFMRSAKCEKEAYLCQLVSATRSK